MKNPLLTIALALLAPAAFAQSSETFDAAFGSPGSPLNVGAPAFPVSLSEQAFDPNLGTLTSVSITLTTTVGGQVDVLNTLATPESFTNAFAQMSVTVTGPDSTAVTLSPAATIASGSVPGGFGQTNFAAVPSTGSSARSASTLSDYEIPGGGSILLTVNSSATGTYGGTATPGVYFGGSANAYGDVKVTYNYTLIPEPATYALAMGAAGLALVLIRRRMVSSGTPFLGT